MRVRSEIALRPPQLEGVEDARHDGVALQRPVRIDREPRGRAVIYDAAAWEVFVFVPSDGRRQFTAGQPGGAEATPRLPNFVVPAGVGQEVAIAFGIGEQGEVGHDAEGGGTVSDAPEDADMGRFPACCWFSLQ